MQTRHALLFVMVLLCCSQIGNAQSNQLGSSGLDLDKIFNGSQGKSALEAAQRGDQVPVDNVIQPDFYYVGPGDVLSYLRLDAMSIEESIVVSPENLLFVPRIGAISVVGKTLSQVRDTIVIMAKQRSPNIVISVGLKRPRLVYISIRGNVLSPGVYALPASMRVQTLIKMSMQLKSQPNDAATLRSAAQIMGQSESNSDVGALRQRFNLLPASVLRNIVIQHSDRTNSICDIQRAEATNSAADDPYLREGDDIFVPVESTTYPTMSVGGGVSQPTTTILKKGDKISFLLRLGGHCTNYAGVAKATLYRGTTKTELQIDENLRLLSSDMDAQAGDLILVDQDVRSFTPTVGLVTVRGEVAAQGSYPIEHNVTRLKQVIEAAGGLNTEAYLPLAYILRRERSEGPLLANDYVERMKKMQYSNLLLEDTVRFALDEMSRKPIVACDFVKALNSGSSNENIVLQDGDVIVIPKNPHSVFVYGQVKNGGYFEYVPGRSMEAYIALAGGMTSEADKGRERVIKGRSGVWMKETETIIEAGDRIYVPHPPDEPLGQQVQRTASYVTMASAIVGTILTAINIYITLKTR